MKLLETLDHYDNLFLTSIFNLDGKKFFSNLLPWISHSANGYYYPALPFILIFINPDVGLSFLITGIIAFAIELPAYKIIKHKIKSSKR
jgi:undecaprenyl-diphosphatase